MIFAVDGRGEGEFDLVLLDEDFLKEGKSLAAYIMLPRTGVGLPHAGFSTMSAEWAMMLEIPVHDYLVRVLTE